MTSNNKLISKEIHLKKRPAGFVNEDDFDLVEVEIPEIRKEGERKLHDRQNMKCQRQSFYQNRQL